ncbi:spore germination protein [Neobacillus sp. LXY-1]|uniref:spore germination protein n=1 Tax=Neobacillus sp. LXY-1 TaxID=3379133 RepID=UPI003EE25A95
MKDQTATIITLKHQFQETKDLIIHTFEYFNQEISLVYLQSICDSQKIKNDIIQHLMMCEKESKYILHLLSLPSINVIQNSEDLQSFLVDGCVLIFISKSVYSYNIQKKINTEALDATVEMSVQGPQKAFSQDLDENITFIRKRYPSNKIRVEYQEIGTLSKTKIALLYDVDYVDFKVLKKLKEQLSQIGYGCYSSCRSIRSCFNWEEKGTGAMY